MICIVNLGVGNFGSMLNMLKRFGAKSHVSSNLDDIYSADKLILPGVGAFDSAMRVINESSGLRDALEQQALVKKVPVLGVCLGMQLLTRCSEEGIEKGLGWVPAQTSRFPKETDLKVPHMGWNIAQPVFYNELITSDMKEPRYYFVHSYYVKVDKPNYSLMRTTYGHSFDSAICNGNIYGVQFHPEKSHRYGMQILRNFAELKCPSEFV